MMKRFAFILLVMLLGGLFLIQGVLATEFPTTAEWALVHSETYDWYRYEDASGNFYYSTKILGAGLTIGDHFPGSVLKVEVKETAWVPDPNNDEIPEEFSGSVTLSDGTEVTWGDTLFFWTVFNECYEEADAITSFHVSSKGFEAVDWTSEMFGDPLVPGWDFTDDGSTFAWVANASHPYGGMTHGAPNQSDYFAVRITYDDPAPWPRWSYVSADVNVDGEYEGADNWVTSGPVPEPGTLLLLGSGLMGLAGYGKLKLRRKKKSA